MRQPPYRLFLVIVLTFIILLAFVSSKSTMGQIPIPSVLPDYLLYRVSVASDGAEGNNHSYYPSISASGRYVAFDSFASNLVPGDNNGHFDIFVHDNYTGETTRVSVTSDGEEAESSSNEPSISADGRFVVFHSYASNLVPDDTNLMRDVFVHDRQTGATTRVSVASDGTEGNSASWISGISANGRFVVFRSASSNLVIEDTNDVYDIFVHNLHTGETTRVSVASDGSQSDGHSWTPGISADGRYIAFDSSAANLVLGDTNEAIDVFVHDRQTGQTTRISVSSDGEQGNGNSHAPSISGDGVYIAFGSYASNLVAGDTNDEYDVFVHNQLTGETSRVSVSSGGLQGNAISGSPSISSDGRYVVFASSASNLVPDDDNGNQDVFVHDLHTGETMLLSSASDGTLGNGDSGTPSISADGLYISFYSDANNLVPSDLNGSSDIFVHNRGVPYVYYTITGRVTDNEGHGIAAVTISISAGSNTATDNDGYYSIGGISPGTFTVTPYKAWYNFTPASRIVSVPPDASNVDFSGIKLDIEIKPVYLPGIFR